MRFLLTIVASILLVAGILLSVLTPVPGGFFIVALGLTLLICTSEWATICIRGLRSSIARFNQGMTWLEEKTGHHIGSALRRTRPPDE